MVLLLAIGTTVVLGTLEWLTAWYIWLIIGVGVGLIYLADRQTEVSVGAEWVQSRGRWVRIYELTKATPHTRGLVIEIDFTDRDGRKLSVRSDYLQKDRLMWDLVYNGVAHSVIAGGAKTNRLLHRAFKVPRPLPDPAPQKEMGHGEP